MGKGGYSETLFTTKHTVSTIGTTGTGSIGSNTNATDSIGNSSCIEIENLLEYNEKIVSVGNGSWCDLPSYEKITNSTKKLIGRHIDVDSAIPSLCCAFLASTTGGAAYTFGLYSNDLKHTLNLSQSQVNTISTTTFCAGFVFWIPGLMVDRYGTRISLILGGTTGALSFFAYWLIARCQLLSSVVSVEYIVAILSFLGILTFLSSSFIIGSVFKIIMSSCGCGTKGMAVGAAKGYIGLGQGVYTIIFEAVRDQHTKDLDFLLLVTFFNIFAVVVPAILLLPNHTQECYNSIQNLHHSNLLSPSHRRYNNEMKPVHFKKLYLALFLIGCFIVGNSVLKLFYSDDDGHGEKSISNRSNFVWEIIRIYLFENKQKQSAQSHNYTEATFLLVAWLAPILSLLFIAPSRLLDSESIIPSLRKDSLELFVPTQSLIEDKDKIPTYGSVISMVDNATMVKNARKVSPNVLNCSKPFVTSETVISEGNDGAPLSSFNIKYSKLTEGNDCRDEHLLNGRNNDEEEAICLLKSSRRETAMPLEGEEEEESRNLIEMLRTPSAMVLLWTTTILVGAGTVQTNDMGQMVESLQFPSNTTSASMALFSVAQALARVCTGFLSEVALSWDYKQSALYAYSIGWMLSSLRRNNVRDVETEGGVSLTFSGTEPVGIPRSFFLVVASIIGVVAQITLSLSSDQVGFVLGTMLSGVSFGMVWPLFVLIVGEVFGTGNVGANCTFYIGFSSAVGTFLLSKVVAQRVYDDHTTDTSVCIGIGCFQITHVIIALLSFTCIFSSLIMTRLDKCSKSDEQSTKTETFKHRDSVLKTIMSQQNGIILI